MEITPVLYLALILVLGVIAQWLAWRLRIPAIVLLLVMGFGVGQIPMASEVIPSELLFAFVSLSVAVILFEGGLSLRIRDVQSTGGVVARLILVGLPPIRLQFLPTINLRGRPGLKVPSGTITIISIEYR